MTSRTMAETAARLPSPRMERLPAPAYSGGAWDARPRVGLAVESMRLHTSSEGWELFLALQHAGFTLHGHNVGDSLTDVREILARESPGTVVLQDAREYLGHTIGRGRNPAVPFTHADALRGCGAFVGTILKDAHSRPEFHRASALEIGCHFTVCYYAVPIVCHLAPFVRREHVVRTYHTIDPALVPPYSCEGRQGAVISGAVSGAYPLRQSLINARHRIRGLDVLRHPGYGASGCHTPEYLRTLSRYKVSICTSSVFGYALRKIVESAAAGCVVVSDLPADEVLPAIDQNVVRVHPSIEPRQVGRLVERLLDVYDPQRQAEFARKAIETYSYFTEGIRLSREIEQLRRNYP